MPDHEQFTIKFSGELLEAGLMDVRELAPALLALGDLLQESNRILNGDRAHVSVQVRSEFARGSFTVGCDLVQGILDQAQEFLKIHPAIKNTKELLEIVFFYVGGGLGVIEFLRRLHGRRVPKEGVTFQNNGIIQINIDNEQIETNREVFNLANDPGVRRAFEGISSPLRREGIDYVEISKADETPQIISKEEVDFFQAGEIGQELLIDNEREAVISIVRLSFKAEHKWGFSDGATKISASIDDPEFWARIQAGHKFAKGDCERRFKREPFLPEWNDAILLEGIDLRGCGKKLYRNSL
ncbi:MAG: hypothetical protein ABSC60_17235 [Acidobacteriota bacterium]|jgi:hypothetical protein